MIKRGTTLVRAHKNARLHSADIGAARRGLNVLASACSGAMFPCRAAAAFHLYAALFQAGMRRVLFPSSHCLFILAAPGPLVKGKMPAAVGGPGAGTSQEMSVYIKCMSIISWYFPSPELIIHI